MIVIKRSPCEFRYDEVSQELFLDGKKLEPNTRLLGQLYDVLYDRLYAAVADHKMALYLMYRGISRRQDENRIRKSGLRFDATVMPPMVMGKEFNKTFGHYHEPVKGAELPELYDVLSGQAHFLLQRRRSGSNDVDEVRLFKAREGDKIVIPPGFGHVTINPSRTRTLVTMKVAERNSRNDYRPFIEKKGGAYYETSRGFIPNRNYEKLPRVKVLKPIEVEGFPKKKCIYRIFLENPERLAFLAKLPAPASVAGAETPESPAGTRG